MIADFLGTLVLLLFITLDRFYTHIFLLYWRVKGNLLGHGAEWQWLTSRLPPVLLLSSVGIP